MRIDRFSERTVMAVSGEIDLSNADRFGDWLAILINENPPAVEIDLSTHRVRIQSSQPA